MCRDVKTVKIRAGSILYTCLQNFLLETDFEYSLISVSSLNRKDVFTTCEYECCRLAKGGKDIINGYLLVSLCD